MIASNRVAPMKYQAGYGPSNDKTFMETGYNNFYPSILPTYRDIYATLYWGMINFFGCTKNDFSLTATEVFYVQLSSTEMTHAKETTRITACHMTVDYLWCYFLCTILRMNSTPIRTYASSLLGL